MLEYFTYKKVKKHQSEKKAREQSTSPQAAPVLSQDDEHFLERIVSAEGTPPPLPLRQLDLAHEAGDPTGNESQMMLHDGRRDLDRPDSRDKGKGKGKEHIGDKDHEKPEVKKASRFSFLQRTKTKKDKKLDPKPVVPESEAEREENDINRILEDLNLSAVNNRAFSISAESQELVQKFTVILKDLVNGVPTAYDDLTHLLDNSQDTLAKSYEHLPSFLQKLIASLPDKLTKSIAPELLAVAAETQGMGKHGAAEAGGNGGLAGAAKGFLKPTSLKDLVTKPGAVVSMLKAIMNALKLRWPAFMGTNVLLSLGLFVLLFVFWYCHKRGREERLKREGAPQTVDSEGRIIELEDDPMLERPSPSRTRTERGDTSRPHSRRSHTDRPRSHTDRPDSRRSHSHGDRATRSGRSSRDERHRERRPGSSSKNSRKYEDREALAAGEARRDRRSGERR